MRRAAVDAAWVAKALVAGGPVDVGEPDLTELMHALGPLHLDRGSILYSPDQPPGGVSIIRSGCVELSQGVGPDRRVLGLLKATDVLGDVSVLQNAPDWFTARCVEHTEVWFLPADDFRRLIAAYPTIAIGWLCNLAGRLTRARTRVAEILGSSLPARIARLLLREGADGALHLPQKTIAQMLGVQRTSVNKILNEFERDGLVRLGYGRVTLLDTERLRELAHSDSDRSTARRTHADDCEEASGSLEPQLTA